MLALTRTAPTHGYDQYGNLASRSTSLGNKTTYTYDLDGFLSTEVTPKGNVTGGTPANYRTQYTRNGYGDPTTITDPRGKLTQLTYDANRNLTDVTDRDLRHTGYQYDDADELTLVTRGDGSTQGTAYNAAGEVQSQTDGLGRVTLFGRDHQQRVSSITDPKQRITTFGYDAAGNRTSITDPLSRTTTSQYDDAGRLVGQHSSSGSPGDVSFGYTADDLRSSMTDELGTNSWTYDSLDRLITATNSQGQTVGYTYDKADRNLTITYPRALVPGAPGTAPSTVATGTVTRAFDDDNRMNSVRDWLNNTTTFSYDANSNLTQIGRPNGTTSNRTFDQNDGLLTISDTGSAGFSRTDTYTRTDNELVKTQTEAGSGAQPNPSYTFDLVARLTSTGATANQSFSYDAADNPTKIVRATVTANQTFDEANQLTTVKNASNAVTATYGYDTLGERTSYVASGFTTTYAYNQSQQLKTFTGKDTAGAALTQTYGYDGTGLRQYTQSSNTRTYETWDGSGDLPLMIEDGTLSFIYGPGGQIIEQVSSASTPLFYHLDQLGSVRALSTKAGKAQTTYSYDPYGKQLATSGTATNPFRYAGQYTDATGLQYLRARYYDPNTAQFLTRDPLAAATRHPYSYVSGDPLDATDPSGLADATPQGPIILIHPESDPPETLPDGPIDGGFERDPEGYDGDSPIATGPVVKTPTPCKTGKTTVSSSDEEAPPPELDGTGKVHGELPSHIPGSWTQEQLEELAHDLQISIETREREMRLLGEDGPHRRRLEEERDLLRQLRNKGLSA